jgi:imidazolonepropionase-like amidohydrolase
VADFLVLKENPLDHIETLMDLDQVYKKGRFRPEIAFGSSRFFAGERAK